MESFKLFLLIFIAAPIMSHADCLNGKSADEVFSRPHTVTQSGACVGVRYEDHPHAINKQEGDLLWLSAAGVETRIGGASFRGGFVATDNGVLYPVQITYEQLDIRFWDLKTQTVKICNQGEEKAISPRDVNRGRIKLQYAKSYLQVAKDKTSLTYYEGCRDSSSLGVLVPLSEADKKVLESFSSSTETNELTDPDIAKNLPDVLGRDEELQQVIANLKTSKIRSTLITGPAGVGKTAIAYLLAKRIAQKHSSIPDWLYDYSVYNIALGTLNSGGLAGKAQEKMTNLLKATVGKKVILLMDEFHQILGMGTSGSVSSDITELMKTDLANGRLALIATMTNKDDDELDNDALLRRFNKLVLKQPSDAVLMIIFKNYAKKMEKDYRVEFTDVLLEHLLDITRQHIKHEYHPALGIKVMEGLASKLDNEENRKGTDIGVNRSMVTPTLPQLKNQIGIEGNVSSLLESSEGKSFKEKVKEFLSTVSVQYIGNVDAVEALNKSLKRVAAGVKSPNRPAAVLLFLGPSGVGKTYLAELFAQTMGFPYTEFNMGNMKDESNINDFLGASAAYVGYSKSGGQLSKWIMDNPESVVNFDEIEKAHPEITEALYGLLDKGVLKDRAGNTVNFQNGYIILTSNFGLDLISNYDREVLKINDPDFAYKQKGGLQDLPADQLPKTNEDLAKVIKQKMINEKVFGKSTEAFVGRVQQIVIFNHFTESQQKQVADLEMKKAIKNVPKRWRDKITISQDIKDYIYDHGFDFDTGARSARDLAEKFFTDPIADIIVDHLDEEKGEVVVSIEIVLKGLNRGNPYADARMVKKDISGKEIKVGY